MCPSGVVWPKKGKTPNGGNNDTMYDIPVLYTLISNFFVRCLMNACFLHIVAEELNRSNDYTQYGEHIREILNRYCVCLGFRPQLDRILTNAG